METDIIARAYHLASECSGLDEVRYKLKREGYASVDAHLSSGSLRADLKTRLIEMQQ
jgi:hypothetical protein